MVQIIVGSGLVGRLHCVASRPAGHPVVVGAVEGGIGHVVALGAGVGVREGDRLHGGNGRRIAGGNGGRVDGGNGWCGEILTGRS